MNKEILRLAIPNIISNISVPLLSAVDTVLMGHLSTTHLAALGVGAMIFTFLYGNFNFLRMGTTGLGAQAYGKDNNKELTYILLRAMMIAIVLGIILIIFQKSIIEAAVYLMNVESSYLSKVYDYFYIRIYAAPAILLIYVLMGWYFGLQNAYYPLLITIVINISNIIFSIYFVKVLHMGVLGAAYGTVIAQYIGLLLALVLLFFYRDKFVSVNLKKLLQKKPLFSFLNININIFIRTVALTFVLAFFYAQAAKAGKETLSVMVLLLQFMIWMAFSIDGFANASESLVGKYYGQKQWNLFYKSIRYCFYWSGGFALLFALFYYVYGEFILSIYTNDHILIKNTLKYMNWVAFMPVISFPAFMWDGIFIGMMASVAMRNAVVLSTILFLIVFYLTKQIDYSWSLWFSFLLFFLFRGILQSWMFYKYRRKLR